MFFKNVFLKTLWDYRLQILIWGGGLALVGVTLAPSFAGLFNGPNKAKLLADYKKATESFSFLAGIATDLDTFTGYMSYQIARTLPVLLAIFGLLAGSGLVRAEEEKGSLDLLLSTPHTRSTVLLQKWAGVAVATLAICLIAWAGIMIGVVLTPGESLSPFNMLLAILNSGLISLFFGGAGLLFSQMTTRKAAAGWAGGILAATFLLNNLAPNLGGLSWIRFLFPFYYENQTRPLAPSIGFTWGPEAVLFFTPLVWLLIGVVIYRQRDHNSFFRFGQVRPVTASSRSGPVKSQSLWLTNSFTFGIRSTLTSTLLWSAGISAYTIVIMMVLNDLRDTLVSLLQSNIYRNLGFSSLASNENLLSVTLFVFAAVLYAAFAVNQVFGWTTEETEGRLELVLSTPVSRGRLLLNRFAASLASTTLLTLICGLVFAATALIANISVNAANSVAAFFGLWVIAAVIEAVGFALSAFGAGRAVAILGGLVVVSYLDELLANLLKLPGWVAGFSIFHQYGTPLIKGIDWLPQLSLLAIGAALVGLAVYRFGQRDLSK